MAVYAFEGIGLILPVMDTCSKPENYQSLVNLVLFVLTLMYLFQGLLNYLVYGSELIEPVIASF
jgi:proton-coupled amino acid transporter